MRKKFVFFSAPSLSSFYNIKLTNLHVFIVAGFYSKGFLIPFSVNFFFPPSFSHTHSSLTPHHHHRFSIRQYNHFHIYNLWTRFFPSVTVHSTIPSLNRCSRAIVTDLLIPHVPFPLSATLFRWRKIRRKKRCMCMGYVAKTCFWRLDRIIERQKKILIAFSSLKCPVFRYVYSKNFSRTSTHAKILFRNFRLGSQLTLLPFYITGCGPSAFYSLRLY